MKYLFLLIALFFLMLAGGSMANSGSTTPEEPDREFIDLFIKKQSQGDGAGDIREEAAVYVLKYYPSRDAALKMLKKNSFKVIAKVYRPDEYHNFGFGNKEHFDETFFGHRGSIRFWDFLAIYKVSIYIRDGNVVRVTAKVDRTFP